MNGDPVIFEERQGLPAWVRVLLLGGMLVPLVGLYVQLVLERPFGNHPMSDRGLIILAAAVAAGLLVVWNLRLITRVRRGEVHIRFWPLVNRRVATAQIVRFEVRDYRPVREFGGWGVRRNWSGDVAYTMKGNRGVQLVLHDGRGILIGSERPDELSGALRMAGG